MQEKTSAHYDNSYFNWQTSIGEFGGWANLTKFVKYISPNHDVLDFGCGGGFLLKNIKCNKKIGVEVNPSAAKVASENGIKVYQNIDDVPDECVDVIISNNALEHTLHPLKELKSLYKKLKKGGKIIFVVPCESITKKYIPNDINHHLYSWSPMCIGNLFKEAGFSLIESKAYIHKWPPNHRQIAKVGGRKLFELACRIYGQVERSWFQVRVIGTKKVQCPFCNWEGNEFLPVKSRKNAKCPECGSGERHRLYYLYLKKKLDPTKKQGVLHFAPEKCLTSFFKSFKNITYLSADIDPKRAMVKEDITNTSFKDNSFDIIFCSHVLEHIEDDRKAIKEMHRILKPGGFAILQVPLNELRNTFEDFTIKDPKEREKVYGIMDHVRTYGKDYKDRLIEAGFEVKIDRFFDELDESTIKKFALLKENIYLCTK